MGTNPSHTTVSIAGKQVNMTSLDKPLWPQKQINKAHFLHYLNQVASHMLPFLKNRHLTVIRYPHGVNDESFFQKNYPPYAPDFVESHDDGNVKYILCQDLPTLIWLGNQLALEFHIPFQPYHHKKPSEIVLDLDPPSRKDFFLAVDAAQLLHPILNDLNLQSYIKTSGNKGLQIYIPLPENAFSYEETRLFTHFLANYLINNDPNKFTIERLKIKRGKRLYVDYLQHGSDKTIIAPYSPSGNDEALISTPLHWHEVNESLNPEHYSMEQVINRLETEGCPFQDFEQVKNKQPFQPVLEWLQSNLKLV